MKIMFRKWIIVDTKLYHKEYKLRVKSKYQSTKVSGEVWSLQMPRKSGHETADLGSLSHTFFHGLELLDLGCFMATFSNWIIWQVFPSDKFLYIPLAHSNRVCHFPLFVLFCSASISSGYLQYGNVGLFSPGKRHYTTRIFLWKPETSWFNQ